MSRTQLLAIHNFAGDQTDDLPFAKGDKLIGITLNGEWWTGTNASGTKTGSFPSNYVQELDAPANKPATNAAGFCAAPPSPVHRPASNTSAPTANYGQLPGASASALNGGIEHKTRLGTFAVVRSLQVLTSLFALSFMGSTTAGRQYMYDKGKASSDLPAVLTPSARAQVRE